MHLVIDQHSPRRRVDVLNEAFLQEFFGPQVASSERMIVEHVRDQSPVVAEDGHVPA